jgi:hypothetical protein
MKANLPFRAIMFGMIQIRARSALRRQSLGQMVCKSAVSTVQRWRFGSDKKNGAVQALHARTGI